MDSGKYHTLRQWLITNIADLADYLLSIPEVEKAIQEDIKIFLKEVGKIDD